MYPPKDDIVFQELFKKGNEDKRFLEYWSRIYSSQLEQGKDYINLKKVISIIILDYRFQKTEEMN